MSIFKTMIFITLSFSTAYSKDLGTLKKRYPASTKYQVNKCENIVKERGIEVLKFYTDFSDSSQISLDDNIVARTPISSPDKRKKYDVLEVKGYVYKGEYRLRFIFAHVANECVLMGEEILDLSSL